jgi:hypothetical protein
MDNDFSDLIISVPYNTIYPPDTTPQTPPPSPTEDFLKSIEVRPTVKTPLIKEKNERRCLCFKC